MPACVASGVTRQVILKAWDGTLTSIGKFMVNDDRRQPGPSQGVAAGRLNAAFTLIS
jgi:hypothetical protein